MNRNAIVGLFLVVTGVVLACLLAGKPDGLAASLFGKAVWYLPYVALVGGVSNLLRACR